MLVELSIEQSDVNFRAQQLEDALYTFYSHPGVNGVLLWGFWDQQLWLPNASLFEGHNITVF